MGVAVNVARSPISATRRRWYAQLWVHVVAGMIGGVLVGHFAPQTSERLQPLGDAFVKAMRMLIAPIVFSTVVVGIANMGDMARVGRVALKALIYFEVMTTIALVLGLLMVNVWQPGVGMHIDARGLDSSSVAPYVALAPEQGVVADYERFRSDAYCGGGRHTGGGPVRADECGSDRPLWGGSSGIDGTGALQALFQPDVPQYSAVGVFEIGVA